VPYKAKEVVRRLERVGFPGDVPKGTFLSILKQAGMDEQTFKDL